MVISLQMDGQGNIVSAKLMRRNRNNELVEWSEDTDKAERDKIRKYQREYYHAKKQSTTCEFCSGTYASQSGLRKHQNQNVKCQLRQIKKQIDEIIDLGATDPESTEKLRILTLKQIYYQKCAGIPSDQATTTTSDPTTTTTSDLTTTF
mgnify:FL=1